MSSWGDVRAIEWPGIEANCPATDVTIAPAIQSRLTWASRLRRWPRLSIGPRLYLDRLKPAARPGTQAFPSRGFQDGKSHSGSQTSRSGLHTLANIYGALAAEQARRSD